MGGWDSSALVFGEFGREVSGTDFSAIELVPDLLFGN